MQWFFIALIAPILWAFTNVGDQYLVQKYTKQDRERTSGGLVIFPSIVAIFIAFFIRLFVSNLYSISLLDGVLLILTGFMTVAWIILYLYALEIEEISTIAPFFLIVPVIGYILGYIFLNESLSIYQIIGGAIIFLGLILISINFNGNRKRLNRKPVIYMLLACLLIALSGVIFKYVTIEGNFWVSSFWEYCGFGLAGIFVYLFIPKHRAEFHYMSHQGGIKILIINIITELMTVAGNLLTNFALLLAPVAMVYIIGSFQPVMVLLITFICTRFFPHIIQEDFSRQKIIPKIIAIVLMLIGSIALFNT